MKIEISLGPLEARKARGVLLYVGLPLGVLVGSAAVVLADVPHLFQKGDALSAAKLNENFAALEARVKTLESENAAVGEKNKALEAKIAVLEGDAPCPSGYAQDTSEASFVLCKKGSDEIVKVGAGPSAFWADRYEASVWSTLDEKGVQFGVGTSDAFPGVEKNGEWANAPLYAMSKKGVEPSRNMTWFQAAAFCRASGKRLPRGEEWLAAGMGLASKDPMESDGSGGKCNTKSSGPRFTGLGAACRSRWGTEDMIGNLLEWTDDWFAAPEGPSGGPLAGDFIGTWPTGFNGDGANGIVSGGYIDGMTKSAGLPSVAERGGYWAQGNRAGLFFVAAADSPVYRSVAIGLRCVLPS